jgi:hypothetical protein
MTMDEPSDIMDEISKAEDEGENDSRYLLELLGRAADEIARLRGAKKAAA